jgi:hypothetical protein
VGLAVSLVVACGDRAGLLETETAAVPEFAGAAAGATASVTGSGHFSFFPPPGPDGLRLWKLTLNAVRHQDGGTSGEWQIVVGASILHGDVDCVTVLPGGTVARVSGIVEDAKFTSFVPGTGFAIEVTDNGQGGDADSDQTTSALAFRNTPPETARAFCETGTAPTDLDVIPMELGNFRIRVN